MASLVSTALVKQRACPSCGGDRRCNPRPTCRAMDQHSTRIQVEDLPPWPCCGNRGEHAKKCSYHPRYVPDADELLEPEFCRTRHPRHPATCIRVLGHAGPHQLATGARWLPTT